MKSIIFSLFFTLCFQFILPAQYSSQLKQITKKETQIETDTVNLPFFEDWSSGGFEENGWSTLNPNILIDTTLGNLTPSLMILIPDSTSEYSYSLTSEVFNASELIVGEFYIDFDLNLESVTKDFDNVFCVEICNSSGWHKVYEIENYWDLDWKPIHIFLDSYALGQFFQIRFSVEGGAPQNINAWHVDNIAIYRTCREPGHVHLDYFWEDILSSETEFGIKLYWKAPIHIPPDIYTSYTYDDLYSGIGVNNGGNYSVASKWNINDLQFTPGYKIKRIRFGINDTDFQYMKVKIWTGENADTLLWQSDKLYPSSEEILTIDVSPYVELDSINNMLWIGYSIYGQAVGAFPAGTDSGPAVAGYGDLISTDGITWQALSDFGLDYNWILGFYTSTAYTDTTSTNLLGYNIYRSENESEEYYFHSFVEQIGWQYNHEYFDLYPDLEIGKTYCYKLTAEWAIDQDTCESLPAKSASYPLENFVCGLITHTAEDTENIDVLAFPNPACSLLHLKAVCEINEVRLVNNLGLAVLKEQPNQLKYTMDVSRFSPGIYFLQIETENGLVCEKIVVQ